MRKRTQKILLIGGTGFVGGYLAKFLSGDKCSEIHVLHASKLKKGEAIPHVKYHRLDLTKGIKSKKSILRASNFNRIVIMTPPNESIIKNIMKIMSLSGALEKVVYLSSILVYPSSGKKQNESISPRPAFVYEKGKAAEEILLTEYSRRNKIPLAIIRLANVYGGAKNRGVIGRALYSIKNSSTLVKNGRGDRVRDYIFIEDAARLIKFVIFFNQNRPVEIFNVCTGRGYSLSELLSHIEHAANTSLSIYQGAAIKEKKSVVGDNKKILKLSGQKIKYDLIRGLKKTYQNYFRTRTDKEDVKWA